jgi:hypothetical protein
MSSGPGPSSFGAGEPAAVPAIAALTFGPSPSTDAAHATQETGAQYSPETGSFQGAVAANPAATAPAASAARQGAAPEPEPVVQIGNIEIIIEAPAAPRSSQAPAAPAPDLSSRFYLRGL